MTALLFVGEALTYAASYFLIRLAMAAVGWNEHYSVRQHMGTWLAFGVIFVLINKWRNPVKQENGMELDA